MSIMENICFREKKEPYKVVHTENFLDGAGLILYMCIHMVLVISAGKKLSSSVEMYYNNK